MTDRDLHRLNHKGPASANLPLKRGRVTVPFELFWQCQSLNCFHNINPGQQAATPPLSRSPEGEAGFRRSEIRAYKERASSKAPRTRSSKQAWQLLAKTANAPPSGLYVHKGVRTSLLGWY
jgi:hypothetical protein